MQITSLLRSSAKAYKFEKYFHATHCIEIIRETLRIYDEQQIILINFKNLKQE